jgi:endoglucanase
MRIVILSVLILLPLAGYASGASAVFPRVDGTRVLDASGKTMHLRGFNVTFNDFETGRLGRGDIRNIRGLGANCIRLVIDCRTFERSPFRYEEKSFELLSRILKWCGIYHVLVVLDMHLVPGIQNPHDFVFHRGKTYQFWSEKQYQKRYYALLAEFAKRYGETTIVAGYDLMNEGVPPDAAAYRAVMNRAAKTVRTFDRNHILVIEEAILPDGKKELIKINDKNITYSIHFYFPHQFTPYAVPPGRAALLKQLQYAFKFSRRYNVPLYVGEFAAQEDRSGEGIEKYLSELLQIMKDKDLNWTYWEYYSDDPGISLYSGDANLTRPDAMKVLRKYLEE